MAVLLMAASSGAAQAGFRQEAVSWLVKAAVRAGYGVGLGVGGNYVYEKLHGSKAEASPAPKLDEAKMRDLIRGMIADQERANAGAKPLPGMFDYLRSCSENPACTSSLYHQVQTER